MTEPAQKDNAFWMASLIGSVFTSALLSLSWVKKGSLYDSGQYAEWRLFLFLVFGVTLTVHVASYLVWRDRAYKYLLSPTSALFIGALLAFAVTQVFGTLIIRPASLQILWTRSLMCLVLGGAINGLIFGIAKSLSLPDIRKSYGRKPANPAADQLP